jgi:hydrogenase expression/formation protein HypC
MCLGIPGQVVELSDQHEHLARVDVSGVGRTINIGLLEDEDIQCGDWVLIHVGFAMSKIDEEEARLALASLQMLGEVYTDEVEALFAAPSAGGPSAGGPPGGGPGLDGRPS